MARATRSSAPPQISSAPAVVRVSLGEQIKVALDLTKDAWAELVGKASASVLKDWQFKNLLRIEDRGALYPTTLRPDEAQNFNAVLWYADLVPMWKWVLSTVAVRGPVDLGLHDFEPEYRLMDPGGYVVREDWHLYVGDWDEKSGGVFWERCKDQLKHHPAWSNFLAAYNNACHAMGLAGDTSTVSVVDEPFQDAGVSHTRVSVVDEPFHDAPKPKSSSTTHNADNGRMDDGGDGAAAAVTEDADDDDDEWDEEHDGVDGGDDGEEEEEEDWTMELSDEQTPPPAQKETKGKKRRRSNKWSHSKKKSPSAPPSPHMFSYCSSLNGGSSRRSKIMFVRGAASKPLPDTTKRRGSSSTSAAGGGSASSSATLPQQLNEQEPKTKDRRVSQRLANHSMFSRGAATTTTTSQAPVAAAASWAVPGHAPLAAAGGIGGGDSVGGGICVVAGGGGRFESNGGGGRRSGLRKQPTGAAPAGTAIKPETVTGHHTRHTHTPPAAAADPFPPSSSTQSVGEGDTSGMSGNSASQDCTSPASTITHNTSPSPSSPHGLASTHPCTTTTSAPTLPLPQAPLTASTVAASHGIRIFTGNSQPPSVADAHSSCSISAQQSTSQATADSRGGGGGSAVAESGPGGTTVFANGGGGGSGHAGAVNAAAVATASSVAAGSAASADGSVQAEKPSSMDVSAYEALVRQELLKALAVDATAALDAYKALQNGDIKAKQTVDDCRLVNMVPGNATTTVLLHMFR